MNNFKKMLILLTVILLIGSFSANSTTCVPTANRTIAIEKSNLSSTKILHAKKKKTKKVWISKSGSKYHSKKSCSKMKKPKKVTLKKAKNSGYTACKKCY